MTTTTRPRLSLFGGPTQCRERPSDAAGTPAPDDDRIAAMRASISEKRSRARRSLHVPG